MKRVDPLAVAHLFGLDGGNMKGDKSRTGCHGDDRETNRKRPSFALVPATQISRTLFTKLAKSLMISERSGDAAVVAKPKIFNSNSYGWTGSGKSEVSIGVDRVRVQVIINVIVIGSNESPDTLPEDDLL